MQTHLYFLCAGILKPGKLQTFWSQSHSSVDGSDDSRFSFHNSPWWLLRDFTTIPWSAILRGSNWPPISEEVPIKGQSSTSFRPEKDVKDGFLFLNQPQHHVGNAWVGGVTLFWPCFDVAEVCVEQHKSRLAEPRNHPETLWILEIVEGPCQVECWFLPGVPQKRCWRKWANFCSQPKKTSNRHLAATDYTLGCPPAQ